MASDEGFEAFGREIESDPFGVLLAKWRQDEFISRLKQLPDVVEVIRSGSLTRGTFIGPVKDIDLIVVFDRSVHEDYGKGRESVGAALAHLQNCLVEQLHPGHGAGQSQPATGGEEPLLGKIGDTKILTHVVRCHDVSKGSYRDVIPIPFSPPVDVMPAVREGSHLLIPEKGTGWIDVDPEKFMREIEQRQREWKYFTQVIKMVKAWAEHNELRLKSVAIEAMVLKYCPRPRPFETLTCGEAIARFFEAAAAARITTLTDPAGRCGEIDPDTDYATLRDKLAEAAKLARLAVDAQQAWEMGYGVPLGPDFFWRMLFGEKYPRARARFMWVPDWQPWAGGYATETLVTDKPGGWYTGRPGGDDLDDPDWPRPRNPEGGPGGPPSPPSGASGPGFWTGVLGSEAAAVPLTFG